MIKLYWQDPNPTMGNDYVINTVNGVECNTFKDVYDMFKAKGEELTDDTILSIRYGGYGEAEVTPNEIVEVDVKYNTWLEVEQVVTFPDGEEEYINFDEMVEKRNTHDTFEDVKREINLLTGL